MTRRVDLVVAGAGIVGLALALAVRQASRGALSVMVADPSLAQDKRGDSRSYAIVAGARRMLESLGVWHKVQAEPMLGMEVTDSSLHDIVRPVLLNFETPQADGSPFAHMVRNGPLITALEDAARMAGVILMPEAVSGFERGAGGIELAGLSRPTTGSLLAACDGKSSRLREAAGIAFHGWRYDQDAIVAEIDHSLPHMGRAIEHFLPGGPFALLPLPGNSCCITWSERRDVAEKLISGDPQMLREAIEQRAAGALGSILDIRHVARFPLSLGLARRFSEDRLALVGDAAHVMHPIAGQGVNYGLRGAAALAEAIMDAARLGLDIGDTTVTESYESARRFDVTRMLLATDALYRLFSNDSAPLRMLRDAGLALVEKNPALKAGFSASAAGVNGLAPRSFRGLPI